jgi:nitroreductase
VDVLQAIATKRAIREYASRPIAEEDLRRIVDAGRRAASSKNRQRWDFVVVRDRERLRELARVGQYAGHVAGAAAAIGLVTPDPRAQGAPLSILFDIGQAAANVMLAALGLGIGSCPVTVYEQERARRVLGYPEDRHCEYLVALGYPTDPDELTRPPRTGRRRTLDDVLHLDRW